MSRNICITAAEGNTGFLIAELLLTENSFSSQYDSLVGLVFDPAADKAKEIESLGAKVVQYTPGRLRDTVKALKSTGCDTLCLIPPASADKKDICLELIAAAAQAGVQNVCLLSSAGCDYADAEKQPRLREFIELETAVLQTKGDSSVSTGHSPCVIRAGFYAENILLYAPQAREEGILPLPIGTNHKFAPVALGDVAQVACHVLTGKGEHGFDDKHRGQMMIVTGPMLCAGEELAQAASQALGSPMQFEDVSESEARKILKAQSDSDEAEKQYILEYYSLVRQGCTNYIATTAYHDVTGSHPTQPVDFFKMYSNEFTEQPKKKKLRR